MRGRRDRALEPGPQPTREPARAGGVRGVSGCRPDRADRVQPFPDRRLRVQTVDAFGDVRGEPLLPQQAVRVVPHLPPDHRHEPADPLRDPVQVGAVAGQLVVARAGDHQLAHPPVRRGEREAAERRAQDLAHDVREAVAAHHLGHVEALRGGELLVRVADAVAPGQREILLEQALLRVHDDGLGDVVLDGFAEARVPELDQPVARELVRVLVDHDRAQVAGQPGDVEGRGLAGLDAVAERGVLVACLGGPDASLGRVDEAHEGSALGGARGDADEADQDAGAEPANGEGLLLVADAGRVPVPRLENRQVALCERRLREPREAGAEGLVPARPDEDAQARACCRAREDLAAVGDVEGDIECAVTPERLREGEVVDAGRGERPGARPCEQERLQQAADGCVGRSARTADQLLAPEVALGAQRAQHASGVRRGRAVLRAGRSGLRGGGREDDGRNDQGRRERGKGEPHRHDILARTPVAFYPRVRPGPGVSIR